MALAQVSVTTTGGSGASAGTGQTKNALRGLLMAIKVTCTAQHANTDVTITEVGGLGRTILTLTNNNTTGVYYPHVVLHDTSGAAQTGQYTPIYLDGYPLLVTVAQGNDGTPGVVVTFEYEPE